jgi:demethylmenaquinone methyltransferase/2-methoxy-6-polyprenyl-1,4-benzoquinol methylase
MSTAKARRLVKNYDRAAWFYESTAAFFSAGRIRASKKYTTSLVRPGEKVIFLGVGTGEEAIMAAQKGACVTCVDISSQMLERLRLRLEKQNLSAEIICQNAFDHERIEYYDACAANYFLNVFRHDEMVRMMNHAASLIKPGGKFMIADVAIGQGNFFSKAFNLVYLKSAMTAFWVMGLVPIHRNYQYTNYFSDAGLELDHVKYFRLFKGGPVVFQSTIGRKKARQITSSAEGDRSIRVA